MMSNAKRLVGRVPPVVVVLAAVLVLFAPALLPGRVLSPADVIFSLPLYRDLAPEGWVAPSNPLLFDQVYQFAPWRHFAWESLRNGDLPLWNPYSSTGTPFVATMQSAVYYPINLLLVLAPFERTFVLSAILRLWIAGLATYLLARRYGLDRSVSVIPAISFTFCSFLIVWLGHPHANVAVWLPAMILAAEYLVQANTRCECATAIGALAAVNGIQLTGGHIETSVDILFGAGVYALVRIIQQTSWRTGARWSTARQLDSRAGTFIAGAALGVGIAAVQLLPFLEWLPLSAEYQLRSQDGFTLFDPVFVKNLVALPLAIVPNLYNNPTWDQPYWSFNPWGNYNESALYAGVIPLLLAVIGSILCWRKTPVVRAWVVVGLIMLAMALQLPGFDWLNQLPGRSLAHPNRLRLIVMLAIAMLAGFGTQALVELDRSVARRWLKRGLLVVVAAYALLFIAGGLLLPQYSDEVSDRLQYESERRYPDASSRPRSITLCIDRMDECVEDMERAFGPGRWRMYMPGLVAVFLLAGLHIPNARHHILPILTILTLTELLLTAYGYNPTIKTDDFYPTPKLLAEVGDVPGEHRITTLGQLSFPDGHMLHGLSDVRGLDFPTAWYDDYLNTTGDRIPWLANGVLLDGVDSALTRFLNVRYVIATPEAVAANDQFRTITTGDGLVLAELISPVPRAFTVPKLVIAHGDEEAAAMLRESPESVLDQVILQDSEEARAVRDRLAGEAQDPATVTLLDYESERSRWQVDSQQPAMLVVSEAYYPGWEATIDGEPAQLFRANLAFRSVAVPAGTHTVEFHYEPRSHQLGVIISLCSLFVTALLIVYPRLSGRLHVPHKA